jgi:type IV pilus assembly protein PilA
MRKYISKVKQLGQGMTEYIIIVALIAVAAIAVTQLFGATIRNQVAGIAKEVAGDDGATARSAAAAAATKAEAAGKKDKSLATYTGNESEGKQDGGGGGGK